MNAAEQIKGRLYYRGDADYWDIPGVNFSTLKELRRSPKHYRYRLEHPREATPSMSLGTAAHIATLEPDRFLREFCLWTERKDNGDMWPRRGPKWEAFLAANGGKKVISEEEYERAIALSRAVREDETAMRYLGFGKPEVAMTWRHDGTGLDCKGRVDWVTKADGGPCIVDLKSTRNADPHWFARDVAKMDYHLQLAFYADGFEAATGVGPRVVVVAVETAPPYDVVTYIVPPDVIEIGREAYTEALERLVECRRTKEWPGHGGDGEKILTLPAWAVPDEDDDLTSLGLEM